MRCGDWQWASLDIRSRNPEYYYPSCHPMEGSGLPGFEIAYIYPQEPGYKSPHNLLPWQTLMSLIPGFSPTPSIVANTYWMWAPQNPNSLKSSSTLRPRLPSKTNHHPLNERKRESTHVVVHLSFLQNIPVELWFYVSMERATSSMLIIPTLFSWFLYWRKMIVRNNWFITKYVFPLSLQSFDV